MPRRRLPARGRSFGDAAGCTPHPIQFRTRAGDAITFVGRDTRGGDCPIIPRPAPTPSQQCAAGVFRRAVDFCVRTSRTTLQQRLCVGQATRTIAHVAGCKEKP